jgi:hypothetical protein
MQRSTEKRGKNSKQKDICFMCMHMMELAEEVGLQISAAATLMGVLVEKKAAMMMTSQGKAKR